MANAKKKMTQSQGFREQARLHCALVEARTNRDTARIDELEKAIDNLSD